MPNFAYGWKLAMIKVGNSLILSSLFCSKLLILKEQLWANRSGYSPKTSNRERFAQSDHVQISQDKRATWANHLFFLSESLFPSQKMSHSLKNIWIKSYFCKFKKTRVIRSLPLFKDQCELRSDCSPTMSDCEQISHQEWATVSESLTKNERISEKLVFWTICSFALFLAKNKWFAEKPMSEFPTLGTTNNMYFLKTQNRPTLLYKGVCFCTNLVHNKSACTWSTGTQS